MTAVAETVLPQARPRFLLGTHQPGWLTTAAVPLFVSDRRLRTYRKLPRAAAPFAVDSGGFTELQYFGTWTTSPAAYIDRLRRYRDQTGHQMAWCAPRDWMCEDIVIAGGHVGPMQFVGTGLCVTEHQKRTVENLIDLRGQAPDLPFIPVIQGFREHEYLACVQMYADAGIDLAAEPLVGLGSVCRRQGTVEAQRIITALHTLGIRNLHGLGIKTLGLARYGHLLASADSLAWSIDARRKQAPLPGCTGHKNCANCLRYALAWRHRILTRLHSQPPALPFEHTEAPS